MNEAILTTNTVCASNIVSNSDLTLFSHHQIVFDTPNLLIRGTRLDKHIKNVVFGCNLTDSYFQYETPCYDISTLNKVDLLNCGTLELNSLDASLVTSKNSYLVKNGQPMEHYVNLAVDYDCTINIVTKDSSNVLLNQTFLSDYVYNILNTPSTRNDGSLIIDATIVSNQDSSGRFDVTTFGEYFVNTIITSNVATSNIYMVDSTSGELFEPILTFQSDSAVNLNSYNITLNSHVSLDDYIKQFLDETGLFTIDATPIDAGQTTMQFNVTSFLNSRYGNMFAYNVVFELYTVGANGALTSTGQTQQLNNIRQNSFPVGPYTFSGINSSTEYRILATVVNQQTQTSVTGINVDLSALPVTNIQFSNITTDSVTITWTRNSDGTSTLNHYLITNIGGTVDASVTSTTITGLASATTHSFVITKVTTVGGVVENIASTLASVTTATPIVYPDAPYNVSATANGSYAIFVYWVTGGNGTASSVTYTVNVYDSGMQPVTSINNAYYGIPVTGLSDNTLYYVNVVKLTDLGNFTSTNYASVTTAPYVENPQPPSSLSASATGTTTISVSWTNNSNGTAISVSYTVYVRNSSTGVIEKTMTFASSGLTISGLSPNTTYTVNVVKVTNLGDYETGFVASAQTQPEQTQTSAPSSFQITSLSNKSFSLSWQPPSGSGGSVTYTLSAQNNSSTISMTTINTTNRTASYTVPNNGFFGLNDLYTIQITATENGSTSEPASQQIYVPNYFDQSPGSVQNLTANNGSASWSPPTNLGLTTTRSPTPSITNAQYVVNLTISGTTSTIYTTFTSITSEIPDNTSYTIEVAYDNRVYTPLNYSSLTYTYVDTTVIMNNPILNTVTATDRNITVTWDPNTSSDQNTGTVTFTIHKKNYTSLGGSTQVNGILHADPNGTVTSATNTSVTFYNLEFSSTYYWLVKKTSSTGEEKYSNILSESIRAMQTPNNPSLSGATGTLIVNWDKNSENDTDAGSVQYELYWVLIDENDINNLNNLYTEGTFTFTNDGYSTAMVRINSNTNGNTITLSGNQETGTYQHTSAIPGRLYFYAMGKITSVAFTHGNTIFLSSQTLRVRYPLGSVTAGNKYIYTYSNNNKYYLTNQESYANARWITNQNNTTNFTLQSSSGSAFIVKHQSTTRYLYADTSTKFVAMGYLSNPSEEWYFESNSYGAYNMYTIINGQNWYMRASLISPNLRSDTLSQTEKMDIYFEDY